MSSLNMKASSIYAISVILYLQIGVVFTNIFGLNTKESSILVISVIIKLHIRVKLRNIFGLAMLEM